MTAQIDNSYSLACTRILQGHTNPRLIVGLSLIYFKGLLNAITSV